ncbi:MAG: hypothetical protein RLZZ371_1856 [Pseudomonadota bacterium]|jgi:Fe-S-cluster containining protein
MKNRIQIRQVVDGNRSFIDMPDSPDNPCTACGACCAKPRVSFYCGELTGGSGGIVPADMASKVNEVIACMKGTESGNGRCIALVGELGKTGISCSIYANRPSTCREFANWLEDGSPNPDCQRLRAQIGLKPLHPLPPDEAGGGDQA